MRRAVILLLVRFYGSFLVSEWERSSSVIRGAGEGCISVWFRVVASVKKQSFEGLAYALAYAIAYACKNVLCFSLCDSLCR